MVVMHACQRRWRQPIKAEIKRMRGGGGRPRKPINKVMMMAKRTRMRTAIKITKQGG